jgi:hypothetical protein
MVTHQVRVGDPKELDADVLYWLRDAYRAAWPDRPDHSVAMSAFAKRAKAAERSPPASPPRATATPWRLRASPAPRAQERSVTGLAERDRVTSGGFVTGTFVLFGGERRARQARTAIRSICARI